MSAAFVVRAIAGIGSIALLGWLALRLFPAEERSPAARIAAAYALGFGLLPFTLLVPALCGARLAGATLLAPVAAGAALAIAARARRGAVARAGAPPASPVLRAPALRTPALRAPEIGAVALLVAVSLLVVALGYALPLYKFDAWAQVGFKAKVFFETRELDGFFGRADLVHYQNADYPLLVPLLETWIAIVIGRWDEHLVKLPIALLFPALLVLFHSALARHLSRGRALAATLALAAIFHFRFYATVGYADLPLAVFAFLAFERLAARAEPARADAISGGLFGGLAAFAKNEGFVVIAGVALVTLARPLLVRAGRARDALGALDARDAGADPRSRRDALRGAPLAAGLFALVALAMNAPWLLFRGAHGLETALLADGAAFDVARLAPLLLALAREATDFGRWNLLWPLAAACGVIAALRALRRGEAPADASADAAAAALGAFALAAATLFAYVGVLLASPFSLDFLVATALERLLVHVVPLAVYATMLTLLGGGEAGGSAPLERVASSAIANPTVAAALTDHS